MGLNTQHPVRAFSKSHHERSPVSKQLKGMQEVKGKVKQMIMNLGGFKRWDQLNMKMDILGNSPSCLFSESLIY